MKSKLLQVLILLLILSACILLCLKAKAQSMPLVLNPDATFWYKQYLAEKTRADSLDYFGSRAISGLQKHLKAANDTIASQNQTIIAVVDDRNQATDRAVKAEQKVQELEANRPKTQFGRIWKGFVTGLKIALPAYGIGYISGRFR